MTAYSVDDASRHAIQWCAQHHGWQRICDIPDSDSLYKKWGELSQKVQASWEHAYPSDPEGAWLEFGKAPCKVPYGFISGAGEFYKNILDVPPLHNSMMVFKTH